MTDGRVEIDNTPIALNRKNALITGHDAGAQNGVMIASLIKTCKLNEVAPFALPANPDSHRSAQ